MEELHLTAYFIYDGIRFDMEALPMGYAVQCPACGNPMLVSATEVTMNDLGGLSSRYWLNHDCGWTVWVNDGLAEDLLWGG